MEVELKRSVLSATMRSLFHMICRSVTHLLCVFSALRKCHEWICDVKPSLMQFITEMYSVSITSDHQVSSF